jgi:hypothetical protein
MNKGKLYLIPVPLSIDSPFGWDAYSLSIISQIRHFIVEEIRTARKFLRIAMPTFPIDECNFQILNEHTPNENRSHAGRSYRRTRHCLMSEGRCALYRP